MTYNVIREQQAHPVHVKQRSIVFGWGGPWAMIEKYLVLLGGKKITPNNENKTEC